DFITGEPRFIYGSLTLSDGLGLVPVAMGLFGIAEVLENLGQEAGSLDVLETKVKGLFPTLQDWKKSLPAIFRGTFIGFFLGILPGGGSVIASFSSYAVEKRVSKHPEMFGKGAIEGVAGPEAANNAATASNFIPLMTLGIPANVVMALILGALMIHGIHPGPLLLLEQPDLFWGVVASMYVGNCALLILNLPLIPLWVRILRIPYSVLFPLILLFCVIGVYSLNRNVLEIIIMLFFGVMGCLMRRFKYEAAPFIFALVLGPIIENALRQSLLMSEGSISIFFTQPISCVLLTAGLFVFLLPLLSRLKKRRLLSSL
ncbi:MAG: tripartite tricarboxylate transporter permease, partial [Candidatus Zixiibacteriota bacterium]